MKKLILACLIAAMGPVHAEEANMRAGLWEIKVLRQVMDGRDTTAQLAAARDRMNQAMANLSPEQRKQMEAMMGGNGTSMMGAAGGSTRVCISQAMASRHSTIADPQGHCEPSRQSRNGNTVDFEFNCSANGRTSVGKGKSIMGGDTVTTSVDMTVTDAHATHTIASESEMTYRGADCQGIKPVDELARNAQSGAR
jgi:hypothetical protein